MTLFIRFRYVLLIILAALSGVVIYYLTHKKEALKLVLPEITKITLVKVVIHQDTAYVDVFAVAENNSPYKLSVDSLVYDLSIGGKKIISDRQYIGLRQERDQIDTVKLSVKVPVKRTREIIQSLQSQEYMGIKLEAAVVYNTIAGVKRISISKDKNMEVPIPPEFRIVTKKKDVRLLQREVDVDLFLHVVNAGKNIDLELTGVQYKLNVGKDLATRGKLGKTVAIRPQSETTVRFPLEFDMKQPVGTIIRIWTDNDRVPFSLELSGYLNYGRLKDVPIVIFTSGKTELVNENKVEKEKEREKAAEKQERKERKAERKQEN